MVRCNDDHPDRYCPICGNDWWIMTCGCPGSKRPAPGPQSDVLPSDLLKLNLNRRSASMVTDISQPTIESLQYLNNQYCRMIENLEADLEKSKKERRVCYRAYLEQVKLMSVLLNDSSLTLHEQLLKAHCELVSKISKE